MNQSSIAKEKDSLNMTRQSFGGSQTQALTGRHKGGKSLDMPRSTRAVQFKDDVSNEQYN